MLKAQSCVSLVLLLVAISTPTAHPQERSADRHWVTTWATAVHAPIPFPGLPSPPVFENQTIRMVVRPTIGGTRIRIRLSNAYGTAPLKIGSAHIAIVDHGASIVAVTDRTLQFGGETSIEIPAGAPIITDPVDLNCSPFAELAVSLFLPGKTTSLSTHLWAQHDSYVFGPGDLTAKPDIPNPTVMSSWYFLADLEVWAVKGAATIVTLGDSITDGMGAKQGEYDDWPDLLAKRLVGDHGAPLAVANEGIGGNRILRDWAGVSALARFDRDVLAQPGVKSLIVLEGINDIGAPHLRFTDTDGKLAQESIFAGQDVTAADLIVGLKQIIDRAHQRGIVVFGATLTPFEGSGYFTPEGESLRQTVNDWIRSGGFFDGVVDFDAAVRNPQHPTRFREDFQSGDQLHPSAAGYRAMAAVVDLAALRKAHY